MLGVDASSDEIRGMSVSALSADPHATPCVTSFRQLGVRLLGQVRAVRPEVWWFLLFACLLLAFGLALVFQPTAGRGGR